MLEGAHEVQLAQQSEVAQRCPDGLPALRPQVAEPATGAGIQLCVGRFGLHITALRLPKACGAEEK